MKSSIKITLVLALTSFTMCAIAAEAQPKRSRYKPIAVENGGAITGVVRFTGDVPKPQQSEITTSEDVCHIEPIFSEELVVSEDGGVKWAAVSIKIIAEGKPFPEAGESGGEPTMAQEGCVFTPHIVVVPVGKNATLLNEDGVLHNVHTWPKKNRSKNIAMPGSVKKMTMKFRRAERIRVTCDVHPWMIAWFIATDNPYTEITDEKGTFSLTDVPEGTYTIEFWHESFGTQEKTVTVEAGKNTNVDFTLSSEDLKKEKP
jgi:plastocyanin